MYMYMHAHVDWSWADIGLPPAVWSGIDVRPVANLLAIKFVIRTCVRACIIYEIIVFTGKP